MRGRTILTTAAIVAACATPAADAARDNSPAPVGAPGVYPESERRLVESPEVQEIQERLSREIRTTTAVVEVRGPSGGFDWGDAGIGAAGMLALLCIGGGSALLLTSPRRRRDGAATAP